MDYNEMPVTIKDFIFYIEVVKGRAPLTVLNYYTDLRTFFRFIKIKRGLVSESTDYKTIPINDVTDEIIKSVTLNDAHEFLVYITRNLNNQQKSRARKAVVLRQFYKYLTNNKNMFEASPLANLELPTPKANLPKYLNLEQAIELLNTARNSTAPSPYKERDYCMIVFFLNCGMRLSELTGINRGDIQETKDELGNTTTYLKVLGKGNKERIIYLNQLCVEAYNWYHSALISKDDGAFYKSLKTDALFVSKHFKRISNRRVQQIIQEVLRNCGLEDMGFSVHKLRHTAATLMYRNGVDIRVLKEVLGHESLSTTQIYTHVANKQLEDAIKNNPLNSSLNKGK